MIKVKDLAQMEEFTLLNDKGNLEREITSGYISDLLSWVMAHAQNNCAWITIMTHMNIIAVASLIEMACIIVAENEKVAPDTLAKADEEGIAVFSSSLTAYEIAGKLIEKGIH